MRTEPPKHITVGDCVSSEPVTIQYCKGDCPTSEHHIDYISGTLEEKECTCCAATVAYMKQITLICPGTEGNRLHQIPILRSCNCDVVTCVP